MPSELSMDMKFQMPWCHPPHRPPIWPASTRDKDTALWASRAAAGGPGAGLEGLTEGLCSRLCHSVLCSAAGPSWPSSVSLPLALLFGILGTIWGCASLLSIWTGLRLKVCGSVPFVRFVCASCLHWRHLLRCLFRAVGDQTPNPE